MGAITVRPATRTAVNGAYHWETVSPTTTMQHFRRISRQGNRAPVETTIVESERSNGTDKMSMLNLCDASVQFLRRNCPTMADQGV